MRKRASRIRSSLFLNLVVGMAFIAVAAIAILLVTQQIRRRALDEAEVQARLILDRNLAIHTYFSHELKPSLFEWTEPFRSADYFDPTWMSSTYAVRKIDKYFKSLTPGDYYYKECAINARSPENEADAYERSFIEELNANPELVERSLVRVLDGQPYFVTLRRGEVLETACLRCHDTPERAPQGLIDKYGPERSFGRQAGEVVSAISIRTPLATAYAAANDLTVQLSAVLLILLLGLFGAQVWLSRRLLFAPLVQIRDQALQIASGQHLGEEIPLPFGKELGELTAAFNTMSINLRHSQDQLEARVVARTAELQVANERLQREVEERLRAEEQLQHYATMLQHSNQELEQFAYVTSHDLQEPLRMVTSYLGLLKTRHAAHLDDTSDEYIYYAVDGATRMQEMIQALLDLSRVSTRGREFAPTDCEVLLARTLRALRMAIQENGAVVTHDPLPTVLADEAQLAQVFQNLVGNAVKFHGAAPPRVHVSAEQTNGEWCFSVQDNGIGIDPAQADRIFQIFQRLHTREEYEGTGIGLALCKKIVERHGGRIWVKSEPGQGATFYVTLPAHAGSGD